MFMIGFEGIVRTNARTVDAVQGFATAINRYEGVENAKPVHVQRGVTSSIYFLGQTESIDTLIELRRRIGSIDGAVNTELSLRGY